MVAALQSLCWVSSPLGFHKGSTRVPQGLRNRKKKTSKLKRRLALAFALPLVVFGVEVGGRWGTEAGAFVARARARAQAASTAPGRHSTRVARRVRLPLHGRRSVALLPTARALGAALGDVLADAR